MGASSLPPKKGHAPDFRPMSIVPKLSNGRPSQLLLNRVRQRSGLMSNYLTTCCSYVYNVWNLTVVTYNAVGQLWCTLCNCPVKTNLLWNSHVQGRTHREVLTVVISVFILVQSAGIQVTQRPILKFFTPQGQHVALMGVKFGFSPFRAKFHPHRCNDKGIGPQKLKFLLRFDHNSEYKCRGASLV